MGPHADHAAFRIFGIMLKRLHASMFLVWYAIMVTGFQVHIHYCCGSVAGVSINEVAGENHSCCDSHHGGCSAEHGCCSSDDIDVSIKDEHKTAASEGDFFFESIHPESAPLEVTFLHCQKQKAYTHVQSRRGPPLYLLYSSRLHYG